MGSWDDKAQKFLPVIAEPGKSNSYLALNGGDQLHDFLLAQALFADKNTMIAKHGALLFGIDSCASGGFIGDLAATDGKESSLGDPKLVRPNIGVMTATSYNKCSIFGGSGKNAFSAFSKGFNVAVGPPHPQSDAWIGAYKTAAKVVQQGQILAGGTLDSQAPQYWSTGDRIDSLTLKPGQDTQDFAFLVVSPGKDDAEAFWNDLFDLHNILVTDYGWSDDPGSKHEIVVLYGDGTQPSFVKEKIDWIDGIANSVSLEKQLTRVHGNFTDSSLGFFYFASHGAAVEVSEPISIWLFGAGLLALVRYCPRVRRSFLRESVEGSGATRGNSRLRNPAPVD
jgi:hypothetical protein